MLIIAKRTDIMISQSMNKHTAHGEQINHYYDL